MPKLEKVTNIDAVDRINPNSPNASLPKILATKIIATNVKPRPNPLPKIDQNEPLASRLPIGELCTRFKIGRHIDGQY
jgi:hypothetical protein